MQGKYVTGTRERRLNRNPCHRSEPVKREIFAANCVDRVIHHLLYRQLEELFIRVAIYDSYACMKDRETLFGIKRLKHHIRSCSENYRHSCHILNDFNHFVKRVLKMKHYGRYVDDFDIVHRDKDKLKALVPVIRKDLKKEVGLTLHPP